MTGENIYFKNKNQILIINGSRGALTLILKLGYNFSDLNFLYKIYVYTVYMPNIVFSILNS